MALLSRTREVLRHRALARGFALRAPWITGYEIGGRHYGGAYLAMEDGRVALFQRLWPKPSRVLELGCLEGGHSFRLAEQAGEVVALDAQEGNLEKCRWLQATAFPRAVVRFLHADLDHFDPGILGNFDAVLNSGLLYHLVEPWLMLRRLASCTGGMLLWTHYAPDSVADVIRGGYRGWDYPEPDSGHPLRGMHGSSFWPTHDELQRMLLDAGFTDIVEYTDDHGHEHGPAVLLSCRSALSAAS